MAPEIDNKIADVSFLDAGGVESIKYPFFLLKELQIPFSIVVDRDFFFPYINNNELDASRSATTGLPIYGDELKNETVINFLFKEEEKQQLIKHHKAGYRKFFNFIKDYGIVSMNYCLEMDLTCSSKACEEYYRLLNTMENNKNQKFLLERNKKAIKDIKKIMEVIDCIPLVSYPESYKKIKNYLIQKINENIN